MEELPEERERETLLSALALLVAKRGASDLLHGPLLLPTPEYFPDQWRPDGDGARAMLGRLLAWARLHDKPFTLETWDSAQFFDPRFNDSVGQPVEHSGTAAIFFGEHEGSLKFGLDLLRVEDAERLAGVLAHEVAHAWRLHHRLVHEDRAVEEQLTDLTTVFLGAGVLTTNNTFRYRSSGGHGWMQYGSEQVGYLSPSAMSFALAVALRVRGTDTEINAVLDALERTQRPLLLASLKFLPPTAALRARLGIPSIVPLPARIALPSPGQLAAPEEDRPSHYAWRVQRHRVGNAALIGFVAATAAAIFLRSYWPFLLTVPAGALGRWWRYDACSNEECLCAIRPGAERCTSCGALFVGRWDSSERTTESRFAPLIAALDAEFAEERALQEAEEEALVEEAISQETRTR